MPGFIELTLLLNFPLLFPWPFNKNKNKETLINIHFLYPAPFLFPWLTCPLSQKKNIPYPFFLFFFFSEIYFALCLSHQLDSELQDP